MAFIVQVGRSCKVAYLHVAGHSSHNGLLLDSHDVAVSAPVWDLALEAAKHTSAEGIIIERDNNSASVDQILGEIACARDVWTRGRGMRTRHDHQNRHHF